MIRWLDTTLPTTFEEFRCRLHSLFPCIYDTKFLAISGLIGESLEYNNTSLEQCYDYYNKSISSSSDVKMDDDASTNEENQGVELKEIIIVNSVQDETVTAQFHNAGK